MGSVHVGVAGIAKSANQGMPYAVAAELICGHLARGLILPIPPGFLIENNGTKYHVSLNFNLAGQALPPADAAALVQNQPQVAWGIVLFDIWVVNPDRHPGNLSFDDVANKVQIFDHSHALLQGNILQFLGAQEQLLGIGGHCLAPHIASANGFQHWADRIEAIPDFYIRDAVDYAVEVGLPQADAAFVADFLIRRRGRIREIVRNNRHAFQALPAAENL